MGAFYPWYFAVGILPLIVPQVRLVKSIYLNEKWMSHHLQYINISLRAMKAYDGHHAISIILGQPMHTSQLSLSRRGKDCAGTAMTNA